MSAPGPDREGPAEMGADAQYLEAGEDDDMHEPVFLGDEHGEVVADLDEEDDAPMSDSDDDEPARPPAADMEDRDAALGDEIEPPSDDSVAVVTAHAAPVFSCAWSPTDGAVFATGGGDDAAFLHRVSDAAQRTRTSSAPPAAVTSHALRGHTDTVAGLAFNHDGSLLASAGLDGKALVWRVADPVAAPLALEGPGGGLEWVRWHPKGDVVLAGSEDFTAWMWNARDGALMQVFAGHSASVSCGGFAPGARASPPAADGSLRLWAPRTGECATLFMGHPFHDGPVTCLDFHPSTEGLIVTGSEDNTARLVSGVSGKVLGTLAAHAETLECVGLSGDFPFAASGAIDAKLVVWDLNTLQPRNTLTHDKAVSALRWIPGTACLYRCVRNERNAKRRRFVVSGRAREPFFARSPDASSRLFFSRFATQRKGLARLFVPMRRWTTVCKTRPSRRTLLRCTATLRSRVNNLHPPTRFVSETLERLRLRRRPRTFYRLIAVSRLPAHARLRDRVRATHASPIARSFRLCSFRLMQLLPTARAFVGHGRRRVKPCSTATCAASWISRPRRISNPSSPRRTTTPRACSAWCRSSHQGGALKVSVFEHINTTPTDAFTSFSSSLKRCGFAKRSTPVLGARLPTRNRFRNLIKLGAAITSATSSSAPHPPARSWLSPLRSRWTKTATP